MPVEADVSNCGQWLKSWDDRIRQHTQNGTVAEIEERVSDSPYKRVIKWQYGHGRHEQRSSHKPSCRSLPDEI
jgi:hypothetical protein